GGIGGALCEAVAGEATVVVVELDADRADAAARRVRDLGGDAISIRGDVSDERAVDALLSSVARDQGVPSILVHAAGYGGPFHTVDEVSLDEWTRIISTNLTSAFLLSRWLRPHM